jgi:hypothetical protein
MGDILRAFPHDIGDIVIRAIDFDAVQLRFAIAAQFRGTGVFAHMRHQVVDFFDMFNVVNTVQRSNDSVRVGAAAEEAKADHWHGGNPWRVTRLLSSCFMALGMPALAAFGLIGQWGFHTFATVFAAIRIAVPDFTVAGRMCATLRLVVLTHVRFSGLCIVTAKAGRHPWMSPAE